MSIGNWPVASLRQRAVYKTEFDMFKENTDIDLISLISFEDRVPKQFDDLYVGATPHTVPESYIYQREYSKYNGIKAKFSNISRNKARGAYDSNGRFTRNHLTQEREFTKNIWNKGNTEVYKAFARTRKTSQRPQRHTDNEHRRPTVVVHRQCKSALDIRKTAIVPGTSNKTRSQTTCGYRPNETHKIKTTTNLDVSNFETRSKEATLNGNVNKNDKSAFNRACRTKSAPATAHGNTKGIQSRKQVPRRNKSGITLASNSKGQPYVSKLNEQRREEEIVNCVENQEYQGNQTDKRTNLKQDEQIVSEPPTCSNCVNIKPANNKLDSDEDYSITNITEREDGAYENSVSANNYENLTSSITAVHEDWVGSRDSGFASNAVTPELEFLNTRADHGCNDELDDAKSKRVKFQTENQAPNIDVSSVNTNSAEYENENSDRLSEGEIETTCETDDTVYDVSALITELETFRANSRLSVISAGVQSNITIDGDADSLCGSTALKTAKDIREAKQKENVHQTVKKESNKPKNIDSLIMSKEARHAIMETLQDMGMKKGIRNNKENDPSDILHKGANNQRCQNNNRNKYEYYMNERTKSVLRKQLNAMDSIGHDDNSSAHSSPREVKECDDTSSEHSAEKKLLPSIRDHTRISKMTVFSSKSKVLTLEQAKKTKYKIPGIGNYHLIASPGNGFEITPPGFDSRYNTHPIISKEEQDIPPRIVRARSIQKCQSWLTNVNMSPLSLRPAKELN